MRSIIISQRLLGTREIAIYHHTGCGMTTFSSPILQSIVKNANPGNAEAAKQVDAIDFLEFEDLEESVRDDVKFLKDSPLLLKETKITGWIYDVDTRQVCHQDKFITSNERIIFAGYPGCVSDRGFIFSVVATI